MVGLVFPLSKLEMTGVAESISLARVPCVIPLDFLKTRIRAPNSASCFGLWGDFVGVNFAIVIRNPMSL